MRVSEKEKEREKEKTTEKKWSRLKACQEG